MAADAGVSILGRQNSIIEPPSAGILIIGDEILKGHTKDTNSHFFLTRLWSHGVKVKAVSVIPDDVDEIASHVRDFSSRFTYVLTSGGIGPTHDDVTVMAIANAFDEPLVQNQYLVDSLTKLYKVRDVSQLSSFVLKMAQVPSSSKVLYEQHVAETTGNPFPLISVHNVYIFPGIPKFLQSLFDSYSHVFSNPENMFYLQKVYLSVYESTVAAELQKVHDKYGQKVHLGSYPEVGCEEFKTKLTLESLKPNILAEALDYLISILPDNAIIRTEFCSSENLPENGMIA
jgi:FAD synthetase